MVGVIRCVSWGGVLLLTLLVYWPGLSGPFAFDDLPNIVENPAVMNARLEISSLLAAATSSDAGPLGRPIPMVSFALNAAVGGEQPFGFKLINVIIHGLNVILVFYLARAFIGRLSRHHIRERANPQAQWMAALLAAAIFAVHPINFTSVLYVVQRMTSLATLFMCLALLCQFAMHRPGKTVRSCWLCIVGYFGCLILALLSKENAVTLVPVSLLLEWVLFASSPASAPLKLFRWVLGLGCVLGIGLVAYKLPEFSAAYAGRPYSMEERLLTQTRALWFYVSLIFFPQLGEMSLFHDDFTVSANLISPVTTLPALLGWIGVVALAFMTRRRWPALVVMVGWFLLGHSLEGSIIPLELVYEHRNYFPMVGMSLGLSWCVYRAWRRWPTRRGLIGAVCLILTMVLAIATAIRSHSWQDFETAAMAEALRKPESPRAQIAAARYYSEVLAFDLKQHHLGPEAIAQHGAYRLARRFFEQSWAASEREIIGLIGLIMLNEKLGLPEEADLNQLLTNRLKQQKFHPYEVKAFVDLLICQTSGACSFASSTVSQWITAALENPHMTAKRKAIVANNATGVALSYGAGDIALYYAQLAHKLAPEEFEFTLTLVALYKKLARIEEMKELLSTLDVSSLSDSDKLRLKNAGLL